MDPIECDHLDAYIGGSLSDAERSRFEAHLARCPDCRAELRLQQHLDALLCKARDRLEPVDPRLVARVERTLEREGTTRAATWMRAGLAAAASVAFILGVPFAWRAGTGITEPPGRREQTAMQQLALFVTGEREAQAAHAHPWVRLVAITPPPERPRSARGTYARSDVVKPATPEARKKKDLVITRGPPPFNARAVQRQWTLGQRRLSELSNVSEVLDQNGGEI
jgi:anti-sigma factor RsiW